jgi:hypothetical protein
MIDFLAEHLASQRKLPTLRHQLYFSEASVSISYRWFGSQPPFAAAVQVVFQRIHKRIHICFLAAFLVCTLLFFFEPPMSAQLIQELPIE